MVLLKQTILPKPEFNNYKKKDIQKLKNLTKDGIKQLQKKGYREVKKFKPN